MAPGLRFGHGLHALATDKTWKNRYSQGSPALLPAVNMCSPVQAGALHCGALCCGSMGSTSASVPSENGLFISRGLSYLALCVCSARPLCWASLCVLCLRVLEQAVLISFLRVVWERRFFLEMLWWRKSKLSRALDPLQVLEDRRRLFSFWYKQIEKGSLECFLWKFGPILLFSWEICGIWWSDLSQVVALPVITYASKIPFRYIWKYPQLQCKTGFLTAFNIRNLTLFKIIISALQNTWKYFFCV